MTSVTNPCFIAWMFAALIFTSLTGCGGGSSGGSGAGSQTSAGTHSAAIITEEVFLPDTMYDMLAPGEESDYAIMAKQPVKTYIRDGQVVVCNYSPAHYVAVKVSDGSSTIASEIELRPWTRTKIRSNSTGTITVDIPVALNPVMRKFAEVTVQWGWKPHNFDPSNTLGNWKHVISGAQLRGFYILNYNMAHFISTPDFANAMGGTAIVIEDPVTYPNHQAIVSAMRSSTRIFNNWIVDGTPSGLGGGTILGLGANQPLWHADGSRWLAGNLQVAVWFHEFSHCFGFSHSSNMTYGQDDDHPAIPYVIQRAMLDVWQDKDGLIFPMADYVPPVQVVAN
jgi:hypothetical protein